MTLSIIFALAGCSGSSEQNTPPPEVAAKSDTPAGFGQQYLDVGKFNPNSSAVLQTVTQVESKADSNYELFDAQAKEVEEGSPAMGQRYHQLYERLRTWSKESGDPSKLAEYGIKTQQLVGGDKQGNVLYTGYFSPVIEMRHKPDSHFKYPIYRMPSCSGRCPSRAQIYNGALKGKGLEIGYTENLIDPFLMEVQGSGFVHFEDTDKLEYFAYGGKNGYAYTSIGRVLIDRGEVAKEDMSMQAIKDWVDNHNDAQVKALLEQNAAYVFFDHQPGANVKGAAGIPLLPMAAVAGDRRFFPMGTPILAEVPLLDDDGDWTGKHELRLVIVLDVGGAVKRGHFDLYHGTGDEAGEAAGHYQHFGRAWKLY